MHVEFPSKLYIFSVLDKITHFRTLTQSTSAHQPLPHNDERIFLFFQKIFPQVMSQYSLLHSAAFVNVLPTAFQFLPQNLPVSPPLYQAWSSNDYKSVNIRMNT